MPGEIIDHNGSETSDGLVRWELPLEGTGTFTAESETSDGLSVGLIASAGLGGLALILLVVGGIFLWRSRAVTVQPTTTRDTIAD